jgi:hypothetical protein
VKSCRPTGDQKNEALSGAPRGSQRLAFCFLRRAAQATGPAAEDAPVLLGFD